MTRNDNPLYFQHVCDVIAAVFAAEHTITQNSDINERLRNRQITPMQYIEAVADEFIRPTKATEVADFGE